MAIDQTVIMFFGLFVFAGFWRTSLSVRQELTISVNECVNVTLHSNEDVTGNVSVRVFSTFPQIALPNLTSFQENSDWSSPIEICGIGAGRAAIIVVTSNTETCENGTAYLSVVVFKDSLLQLISDSCGWAYFFAWGVSSYPQMYQNYARKSVVGLDFDYVALTFTGHFFYFLYNSGMYLSTEIQSEYFRSHPRGVIPVMLNDVVYSFYTFVGYFYMIYQCCRYEKGTQQISCIAKCLLLLIAVVCILSVGLAYMSVLQWLDALQYCSYIKLITVTIKYVPQALTNYRRKSTVGWSIVNVNLSVIGSIFSLMQMSINCYNYNDPDSIFGNLTKFGMAVVVAVFNLFFMYQHYVLYRNPYDEITA